MKSLVELVRQQCELGLWTGALFFADKASALQGHSSAEEIYLVGRCMVERGEYQRAAHAIVSRRLHKSHLLCHYVAARALLGAKEYAEALRLLQETDPDSLAHPSGSPPRNRVSAAVALVKGRALAALDSRQGAGASFVRALHEDVFCYEALDCVARHHALAPAHRAELLDSLPFEAQCDETEATVLRLAYRARLDECGDERRPTSDVRADPALRALLDRSSDAVEARARTLLYRGDFEGCLRALGPPEGDGERASELRTACLAELRRPPALFLLAHRLVDEHPQSAVSWFAVGCYYYVIGKSEPARRYLSKATTLDRCAGAAWLAYGHSFAADNEHDQATAAYFKAGQLMSGCHLPPLYVGLECGLTNNPEMADKFFKRALALAPDDPHVAHEMGVVAFQNRQHREAERLWRLALSRVRSVAGDETTDRRWQPLLNNLGHACRKNGKHSEAIAFHRRALTLVPGCGATYAALGLCHALDGDTERAIDAFHASLSKRPDDSFASTMLKYLVDELGERASVADAAVPEFPFPESSDFLLAKPPECGAEGDGTRTSDMSMSFDD